MEILHLAAFIVLMPLVALGVGLGSALAVTLFVFVIGYLGERKWGPALRSYFWFSLFIVVLAAVVNILVTHRVTLIPEALQ